MVVLLVHKMQVRHWKCVPNMHQASEQQQYRNSICARLWVFCFSLEAEGDCDSGGAYIYILNNQEYFENKNVAAMFFVQHSGGLHVVLFQYKSFTFHIVFKNMVVFVHLCSPIFLRRVVLFHSVLLDTP